MRYYFLPPIESLLKEEVGEIRLLIYYEGFPDYQKHAGLIVWDYTYWIYCDDLLKGKHYVTNSIRKGRPLSVSQGDLHQSRIGEKVCGRYLGGKKNLAEVLRAVNNSALGRVYSYVALDPWNNLLFERRSIPADSPQEVMKLARDHLTAYQSR